MYGNDKQWWLYAMDSTPGIYVFVEYNLFTCEQTICEPLNLFSLRFLRFGIYCWT